MSIIPRRSRWLIRTIRTLASMEIREEGPSYENTVRQGNQTAVLKRVHFPTQSTHTRRFIRWSNVSRPKTTPPPRIMMCIRKQGFHEKGVAATYEGSLMRLSPQATSVVTRQHQSEWKAMRTHVLVLSVASLGERTSAV